MTPVMEQWARLKQQVGEAWLFFRLGDFYELFEDDAREAAPILEVQLTSRDGTTPMCGVPYHALDLYLERALAAGHSVAVAEQLQDPRQARGLVERGIVRWVTPGTHVPDVGEAPGPLAALVRTREGFGLALLFLTEGRATVTGYHGADWEQVLASEWIRWRPAECLLPDGAPPNRVPTVLRPDLFRSRDPRRDLVERLQVVSLTAIGIDPWPEAQRALLAAIRYTDAMQGRAIRHLTRIEVTPSGDSLWIAPGVPQQLAVEDDTGADLLHWLNVAVTPMGRRLVREWVRRPLRDPAAIDARLDGVEAWRAAPGPRARLRDTLAQIGDVERAVARLSVGLGDPRDLARLSRALNTADTLAHLAATVGIPVPELEAPDLETLRARLHAIDPEAGPRWDEGRLVRPGVDATIDELRELAENQRGVLGRLEERLRHATGLRSLKVGVHRTLGYFIEVSRRDAPSVPPEWRQRQSMAASVRFTMPELEEVADRIAAAESAWREAEERVARTVAEEVIARAAALGEWSRAVARLDALAALAEVATRRRLVRPRWHEAGFRIIGLRHPLVEETVASYVPSDLVLEHPLRLALITGPNMAGKSTFMRAVALNAWLHHIGSFVAATEWAGPPLDGIFTRIGADDNLTRGQSTFMVEMEETALILRQAGPRSLVLLDELGRGTSTFDGLAIAWAVAEELAAPTGPYTFFATHYRELTALDVPTVARLRVDALVEGRSLVLLHEVKPGVASQSFGVAVAAMAGLPGRVLRRAERLLKQWEKDGRPTPQPVLAQTDWLEPDPVEQDVLRELRGLNLARLTPLDALTTLHRWQERLGG